MDDVQLVIHACNIVAPYLHSRIIEYLQDISIEEVKQGKIDFKVDKSGIVHTSIGKVSFSPDQIRDNAKEFISTLIKLKPTAAKGTYIKSIYLSSTMSAGIKIDPKSVEEI